MSYQVLARKWRPQSFDDVVGQEHVTVALRNAIRQDRVPHAILLTGPRGVGKTTLARLLARCLNCDKGPTDAPCGSCHACTEIASGISTDVQEIDAASRTSVDDVRELVEAVRYAPSPGKHRIFVVDEVHMLSTAAFNALLKTLEEPPPRSLFVFATTNPEKIPFTVLSRCQRHDLRRLPTSEVVSRIGAVARSEGITISDASLLAVAREGEGSLRDALTLLDQVIAVGGDSVDDERVADILDLVDRHLVLAIAAACVDGDAPAGLEACARAATAGIDAQRLGSALLSTVRDLVVLQVAPDREGLVEGSDAEIDDLRAIAGRSDDTRLRRMFRVLVREQEDLAWSNEPFAVLEMAVVRMATLAAGDDVARLIARIDALERRLGSVSGGSTGGGAAERVASTSASPRRAAPGGPGARRPAGGSAPVGPTAEATAPTTDRVAPPGGEAGPSPLAPGPAHPAGELRPSRDPDAPLGVVFDRLRAFAQRENRGLFAVLDDAELVAREDDHLRIVLPEGFPARRLRARQSELEGVCARFFGRPTRVELESSGKDEPPPRIGPGPESDLARRRRQEALEHPSVNRTTEILGAEIVEIRPIGGGT